jgi:antitoxin (DNA-binding transcriptional repressor) of toxin-antitoxin stability system
MKSVNIAKFKAELGKYLGFIRRGEEIIVLDRSQPLARVLPFKPIESKLIIEEPLDKKTHLSDLHFSPLKKQKIDSLKYLIEERGER